MFEERMQAGMTWIGERLQELCGSPGVDVVPIGWDADIIDLKAHRHLLVVALGGRRTVIAFDDVVLEEVIDDPALQLAVDRELNVFLERELNGVPLV